MMKLHWSPRSPFVRKVMIVLDETGLRDQVICIRSLVATHLPVNEVVIKDNPLGKIPTLVTDDGKALYDSRVICEYLDLQAGTHLFPADLTARMNHITWQALGDGLTDILLIWRIELGRDTGPWDAVTLPWLSKVRASMAQLEVDAPALEAAEFGIGHVSVFCALGQLDFRWPDCNWKEQFPGLATWFAGMARRPSFVASTVVDDQAGTNDITAGRLTF